jgi:hypothetical protein
VHNNHQLSKAQSARHDFSKLHDIYQMIDSVQQSTSNANEQLVLTEETSTQQAQHAQQQDPAIVADSINKIWNNFEE